ncbi:prolipoprotein diacylglyceryl transferase [Nocardioides daedukensis]|uniref:Phosphatidylglycerol--prolipoprotein diacylglyceryl transferase n=1 Tax=Nocardioides daedukensis TaxID=634462 RepID=A0A7Y9S1R7_9ACTN|nr:prolipoprotein diacylglyceryl transferase [Nocardioides daedukensis]NYG57935.1 prolipoprotein diacylglyceryl transferase [Nocardioides daedukensis]
MILQSIPSPSDSVWELGPLPIRAYALCIILGVVAAIWVGEKRWVARGGKPGQIQDIAIWAIPFGLVGARLYHVISDYHLYFGEGKDPITALYVWRGGLSIWGAIALGALGAFIGARTMGLRFTPILDSLAPGVLLAQAFGRWGNYFNQELFGKPTDKPWGLEIDVANRPTGYLDHDTFHPTFLYECVWNLGIFGILIWADAKFKLGFGRVMALYVAGYTLGRGWIEYIRIDDVQMDDVFGLRLNVWTSIILFVLSVAYFIWSTKRRPGREESVFLDPAAESVDDAAGESADAAPAPTRDADRGADGGVDPEQSDR